MRKLLLRSLCIIAVILSATEIFLYIQIQIHKYQLLLLGVAAREMVRRIIGCASLSHGCVCVCVCCTAFSHGPSKLVAHII